MKKLLGMAGKWFMQSGNVKTVVDGIDTIGKNKVNKKKVALVVTIVLAVLALFGAISEETFIELFKEVN